LLQGYKQRYDLVVNIIDYFSVFDSIENMNEPAYALRDLGLSDKESSVYMALVSLEQATAYQIANKSGIKRPTVYVTLEELRKKGLVLKVPHPKKQVFIAKDPEDYIKEIEQKIYSAKQALPQIIAMIGGSHKPKVTFYEGIEGVSHALSFRLEKMKGKELIGFFATSKNPTKEYTEAFATFQKNLQKNNISIRGIAPESITLTDVRKEDEEHNRTIKSVSSETYSSNISIDVGDTFVRIIDIEELQATIIENPNVAKTMRQIFEMVWGNI
jgi:sugar-specific transcriptional regulator TrmB